MSSLGSYLLLAAFVTCAYAVAASIAGARRRSERLVESGVGAFYLVAAIIMFGVALPYAQCEAPTRDYRLPTSDRVSYSCML